MPKREVYTEVEGQKVKLTNLDKVLYPDANLTKAEVISYYLEVAPKMVPHLIGRPLTLIRFPDGIHNKTFYTKNMPSWTPDWMGKSKLPWDEGNTYLVANNTAHLVWLANLASLEIHTMNSALSKIQYPDKFVIDLDPPEDWGFDDVKDIAEKLKVYLDKLDYRSFAKLSGGKGIHIVVPMATSWTYEEVQDEVKKMMKDFIRSNKVATLNVHKERRKGKILLDIYRNHAGNTTVCPYSLRGKPGAPVSMPLTWSEILASTSAQDYNMQTAKEYWQGDGEGWKDFFSISNQLHSANKTVAVDENLDTYVQKRNFSKTEEPGSAKGELTQDTSVNNKFVIQLHDASNLHYDLRLGMEGVLKSWAIPKGLPIVEGVKRLAIQTEDHPAKYIDFEGVIPKEEYGGGEMWVFDTGKIIWSKQSEKHLKFEINGKYVKAKYNLYRTKENHWIIELDQPDMDAVFEKGFKPMLADVSKGIPKQKDDYLYEIKWDGIRVIVYIEEDEVKIISRSGRDITNKFPEFTDTKFSKVQRAIFDAELVCLDEQGRPVFADIISRMHRVGNISGAVKSKPVYMYIFDCLYIDGVQITGLSYERRRSLMKPLVKWGNIVRESKIFENGNEIYEAAKVMQLEGIMAKQKKGTYKPGDRSNAWQKIKFRQTIECTIIGYTEGKGDRASLFGALHVAVQEGGAWKYYGKVGTGFDHKKMKVIFEQIKKLEGASKPIKDKIEEEKKTTWIEARFQCEIQYASLTNNDTLREPVFLKMWPKD